MRFALVLRGWRQSVQGIEKGAVRKSLFCACRREERGWSGEVLEETGGLIVSHG